MPDIFLSYNREDAAIARAYAEAFRREGLEVWWDAALRSGEAYDKVTEAALREARAVVVLWSPRSVESRWVRAEATIADQNRTLVPVTIEACRRPVMFELTHTADLSHWRGAKTDKAWRSFLDHVRRMVEDGAERATEAPSAAVRGPAGESRRFWHSGRNRIAAAVAAALLIIGAGATYMLLQPAEHGTATQAAATKPGVVSLAVLPFVNLSSDKKQEFLSDGMTEEITTALAKVPGLNVIGRTSAFQFRGANKDLRAIGQALGANHLIEGSVQKEGNEVRITAKLIKVDDGTSLWTETYNRELKGVFAIQEEIATAIAGALRVPLGLNKGQSLVANRTADTESYQDYLRAKALFRARGSAPEPGGPLTQATKLLEQVVVRDPNYAPAWGLLAQTYLAPGIPFTSSDALRRIAADQSQKTEAAAQQAIRLDSNNAEGYLALAQVRQWRGRFVEAEDLLERARSLDPGNPDFLQAYSLLLARVGRLKEALSLRLLLRAQEPSVHRYNENSSMILWANGRTNEALAIIKAAPSGTGYRRNLARVYASMGRYNDAAETLQGNPSGRFPPGVVEEAVRLLRTAPAKLVSPPTILSRSNLSWVYLHVGAPDRVLDWAQVLIDAGIPGGSSTNNNNGEFWAPAYAPVRRTERFKTIVRKMGLVDYWRARGWPEYCRPTTGDDFACR